MGEVRTTVYPYASATTGYSQPQKFRDHEISGNVYFPKSLLQQPVKSYITVSFANTSSG